MMSYFTRVSDESLARMICFQRVTEDFCSKRVNEYLNNLDNALSGETIRDREWIANKLSEMQLVDQNRENSKVENVLLKAVNVLAVLGYSDLAKELGTFAEKFSRSITVSDMIINEIINGAIKKNRSVAASGSRHSQKEEIIDVIKETWITYPWGSKNRMIQKILERYRVVEKTLKIWMKEENLAPLETVISKNYPLVIPLKWQNMR